MNSKSDSNPPKPKKLQAVKGMNDVLPSEGQHWETLEELLRNWLSMYGYRLMKTPVLEDTSVFRRGIGEVTDIVEKEMFSFVDQLNGDQLTLRPEFTAGIARSCVQHTLTHNGPQRIYQMGPVFRHERPQRGRYRQFNQLDVEALGFAGPDIDAEMVVMLARLWSELDLKDVRLEINCLGQPEERQTHREALISYFEANQELLDADAQRRLHSNPLRILDTKNPTMQTLVDNAPRLSEFLGEESLGHYNRFKSRIALGGVQFTENPRLVRGLDYYNLTVFEWITDSLGAQGTICGGGRYDGLVEIMGGKPTPAIGFAIGLERLLDLVLSTSQPDATPELDLYLVHQGEQPETVAFLMAEMLRDVGFTVVLHAGGGSFKSQMKKADASGALAAIVLGDNEIEAGTAIFKPLRSGAEQVEIKQEDLFEQIFELLYDEEEDN